MSDCTHLDDLVFVAGRREVPQDLVWLGYCEECHRLVRLYHAADIPTGFGKDFASQAEVKIYIELITHDKKHKRS